MGKLCLPVLEAVAGHMGKLRLPMPPHPQPGAGSTGHPEPMGCIPGRLVPGAHGEIGAELEQKRRTEDFLSELEPLRHQLYGYARRALNRPAAVADVLQEVVLTAWREYPRFVPGTNFRAWVFRIMVNTVFNFNKRGARERVVGDESALLDVEAALEHEVEWAALLEDPDRLRDLLDERLVHAIDALSESERQCFLLCLLYGFSYKEASGMLGLPLGTVMSHIHRARMKLRERLASLAVERRFAAEGRS